MDRREAAEAWLAGVMADADRAAYERSLMSDPEARRELLAAARRDLALGRAVAALDERGTSRKRRVYVARPSILPWAVAAALAIVVVGLLAVGRRPDPPPTPIGARRDEPKPEPEVEVDPLREEEIRREEDRRRRLAELAEIEREKQRLIEEKQEDRVREKEQAEERVLQELKRIDEERPKPPPPPPAPAAPEPTRVAALALVRGEATVNGAKGDGVELRGGETVEGRGRVSYSDGGVVVLDGASLQVAAAGATLNRGTASFSVGKAFVVTTPQAELRVLGTRFTVRVTNATRVDVEEGLVRLVDRKTKRYATVARGQSAEAGAGGAPSARLIGLAATYFDRMDFRGPAIQRVDRGVDLLYPDTPRDLPPIGRDRTFSVRWEGLFLAEEEGDYAFVLSLDGAVKLSLDGQALYTDDLRTPQPIHGSRIVRRLAAGWHDLLVEYADDSGVARVSLRYVPPGAAAPPEGLEIPPRLFAARRR
jgi:ferric-dicitrate binding protein FerR (iron transport regulator)